MGKPRISEKASRFTESVIREMTRLCNRHGGVNLAQGFPDFPAPEAMKRGAIDAINREVNQYSITWGAKELRDAIAEKARRFNKIPCDSETGVVVCCGSTECMISTLLAVVNPGDEVILFEPWYENYGPDAILCGARPRMVRLREPGWSIDGGALRAAFNDRTKAIILNTPHNPTGKVYSRAELELIAQLCRKWDVLAVTDEIYEHILYDGREHISIASLEGMADRTVTISGASKTYSCTGWRVGYCVAPPDLTGAIRKVHDFLTVGAPAPLQQGVAVALQFGPEYYAQMVRAYTARRDLLYDGLNRIGFRCAVRPEGSYYIMADISGFGFADDVACAKHLVEMGKVAAVPGSSFYSDPKDGAKYIRFCYPKKTETLEQALRNLEVWAGQHRKS